MAVSRYARRIGQQPVRESRHSDLGGGARGYQRPVLGQLIAVHPVGRLVVAQHPYSSLAANLRVGVLQLDDALGQEIEHNHARADRAQADLFGARVDDSKDRRLLRQDVVERRVDPAVIHWRVVLVENGEPTQDPLAQIADEWLGGFEQLLERARLGLTGARCDEGFESGAWSDKADPTARVNDGEAHHVSHVS